MKRSTLIRRLKQAKRAGDWQEYVKLDYERQRTRTPLRALMDQGEGLVDWLNYDRERDGDKTRVVALIKLLKELRSQLASVRLLQRWRWPEAIEENVKNLEKDLEKRTSRYISHPFYVAGYDGGISRGARSANHSERISLEEWQADASLEGLVRAGFLDRLTLCSECQNHWVFRSKATKQYCSLKCRQKRYESTPERKEKRKSYYIPSERRNNGKKKKA